MSDLTDLRPTFAFVLEDNSLKFEWIDDNIRVTLFVDENPLERMQLIKTTDEGQDYEDHPQLVGQKLAEWLGCSNEEKDNS